MADTKKNFLLEDMQVLAAGIRELGQPIDISTLAEAMEAAHDKEQSRE